jgi:hypothetical protein
MLLIQSQLIQIRQTILLHHYNPLSSSLRSIDFSAVAIRRTDSAAKALFIENSIAPVIMFIPSAIPGLFGKGCDVSYPTSQEGKVVEKSLTYA